MAAIRAEDTDIALTALTIRKEKRKGKAMRPHRKKIESGPDSARNNYIESIHRTARSLSIKRMEYKHRRRLEKMEQKGVTIK